MSAPTASAYRLPDDLAVSDRSRKFYDGTYKWNAQGFTDEHGVYREFDFLDPLARAPTPMPPMFSDDEEDGDGIDVVSELTQSLNDNSVALSDEATVEPGTPYPKVSGSASSPVNVRSPGSIRRFAINLLRKKTDREEHAPQNDSKKQIEDVVPAPEQAGELRRDHELVGRTPRAKDEKSEFNMPETPPKSPVNIAPEVKTTSPTSTTSTLSSAPSTLSEESKIHD
ncbi:hypothetical protein C7974DRAFT_470394 [Boeremia exigua]|uniref:uncharacterized protein n=1 Tax=Boeremia exigua TaxID=749465 RepID=UPI001E8D0300|nr:uncharacterized protein C7974DRAFT_470394 [Boeremia exigua]KAH6637475.1 hypothetical protein C7974DRAFT_470394 [Boeremia exigua]